MVPLLVFSSLLLLFVLFPSLHASFSLFLVLFAFVPIFGGE